MKTDILEYVPIGEQNATGAKEVWDNIGGGLSTVKGKLNEATIAGQIKRKKQDGEHVYWREGAHMEHC